MTTDHTRLNEYISKHYLKYYTPDSILLLSDGLKPKYVPDFYIDTDSALNLSNYDSKGNKNTILFLLLAILIIGAIIHFLMSYI